MSETETIPQGSGTYDSNDPRSWDLHAASGLVVGLDIGIMQDHSAIVLGGVSPQAQSAVGIVEISRFPLGSPLLEVPEQAAALSRRFIPVSGWKRLIGTHYGMSSARRL